ncbi:hypothetical protein FPV67DRAFT_518341 [Lyophyllum atratum]|nr:hypothetical protein FPV67DRAFT_518341 [Lyophyllum atratum]
MAPVICSCTICSTKTVTIHGVQQPGQQVDVSTRLKHEKRDKRPASPKRRKRSPSPASVTKHSRGSNAPKEIDFPVALIVKMVCVLVTWLHIRAGMSRSVANTILRAVQLIISTTLYLIEVSLSSSGVYVKSMSSFRTSKFPVMSVRLTSSTAQNQKSFEQLVALGASLFSRGLFLGNASGRLLLSLVLAIQSYGHLRTLRRAQNGFHDACIPRNPLIPGYSFFCLAKLLKIALRRLFAGAWTIHLLLLVRLWVTFRIVPHGAI